MVGYIKIRGSCKWRSPLNSRWIFITFFIPWTESVAAVLLWTWKSILSAFQNGLTCFIRFRWRSLAIFKRKWVKSARRSPFRIFDFLVVSLLFRHVPPCNKLVALKWSLIWSMWSQNDRRWVYPTQWPILRCWAVKIPPNPNWPCSISNFWLSNFLVKKLIVLKSPWSVTQQKPKIV